MNKLIPTLLLTAFATYTNAQVIHTVKEFKFQAQYYTPDPISMQIDSAGNVYNLTMFTNMVDFDPAPTKIIAPQANNLQRDIAIAKYDNNFNLIWVKKIGGRFKDGLNSGYSLNLYTGSTQPQNHILLCGSAKGLVDFEPNATTNYQICDSISQEGTRFVAMYDTALNLQWIKTYQPTNMVMNQPFTQEMSVKSINSNTQKMIVYNQNTTNQTWKIGNEIVPAHTSRVTIIDKNGNTNWSYITDTLAWSSSAKRELLPQYIDNQDNLYATDYVYATQAFINDSIDVKLGAGYNNVSYSDTTDWAIIAKYTPTGTLLWHKYIATITGTNYLSNVFTDAQQNVYIDGNFTQKIGFATDTGLYILNTSPNNTKRFIAKYSSVGQFLWASILPSSNRFSQLAFIYNNELCINTAKSDTTTQSGDHYLTKLSLLDGTITNNYTIGGALYNPLINLQNDLIVSGNSDIGGTQYVDIDLDDNVDYLVRAPLFFIKYRDWNVSTDPTPAPHTNVKVYPNPVRSNAHSTINVQFGDGWAGSATIAIHDAMGKKLMSQATQATTTTINISGLAAGIYTLKVSGNNANTTHKLVVY
jgi:hypothetical protein